MIERINNFLSAVLKSILLVVVVIVCILAIPYIGVTIWGNITEHNNNNPSMPKAKYLVKTVTGQQFLTNKYETLKATEPQVIQLDGFYFMSGDKWEYSKNSVPLDEYYWGQIDIKRR